MIVFRLSRKKYRHDLSGKGAEIVGGRWNSRGIALLYTGENRALCTTEIAVHTPLGNIPQDYFLITIELPDTNIEKVLPTNLPKKWRTFPHQISTKSIGDNFVQENKSLILQVPSAVIQGEYNYLINPQHEAFKDIKIIETEAFFFDKRLFDKE